MDGRRPHPEQDAAGPEAAGQLPDLLEGLQEDRRIGAVGPRNGNQNLLKQSVSPAAWEMISFMRLI